MQGSKLKLIIALLVVFNTSIASAGNDICASASLTNPNSIDGGMGGTGAPLNRGMGGTGSPESGMGGTGILERGGLGGTGIVSDNAAILPDDAGGGIAIMGVITGFASICVNGEEVHYENATPVYSNGQPAKLGNLAVGKTVMLKAERVNGRLNARAIGLYDAVAGPVGRIDIARQQMQVMGQTVKMNTQMMQQVKDVGSNATVSVSGHRLDTGEIIATRVDTVQGTSANTMGVVTNITKNSMSVNGTKVNVSDAKLLENLKVGSEVRVSGEWSGSALKVNRVDAQPTQRLVNRADSAILEGYVRIENGGGKLSGSALSFTQGDARAKEMERSNGKLVKVELRRTAGGSWVYDKVEERKGRLFDKYDGNQSNGINSSNSDSASNSNSGADSDMESKSGSNTNSGGHGSGSSDKNLSDKSSGSDSSGHGSSSGSNSHESNSGSSSRDSSSRSSGSSGSSHGDSRVRIERVDRSSKSSGSGSSDRSSRSGKNN